MSGNDVTRRRRTLIVDGPLQRAFVVDVAMVPTLAMGVTTVIVAAFCHRLRIEAEHAEVELESLAPLFVSFACFVLASGFAIVYQAVRISNRVAGPQVNMKRVVDRVLAGDKEARVRLRENDFMLSAADDINRLLDHFTRQADARPPASESATVDSPSARVDDVPAPPPPAHAETVEATRA